MNCWKSVNYTKQFGSQRLFIISLITTLLTFILLYIPISYFFHSSDLHDNHIYILFIGLIMMYPAHKFLHYLPLAHLGSVIKKNIVWKYRVYPYIQVKVYEPIGKHLFLIALLTPFVSMSLLFLILCFVFPHYVHYITILLAYGIGLSVPDFVYAYNLIKAPRKAYIEENDDGLQILVQTN